MGITVNLPATLQNGTTADASQVAADLQALVDAFLLVAEDGANSSITSLSGLTTPLSVAQGGTGTNTAMAYAIGGLSTFMFGTTVTIMPGFAVDTVSGNAALITLPAKVTKTLTGSWVAGSGNAGGGTFTAGQILNVWLIRKPADGSVDVFVSLEMTGNLFPTFPTGYTQARRIGALVASFNSHMNGDLFLLDIPGGLPSDVYNDTANYTGVPVASNPVTASTQADSWLIAGTIKSSAGAAAVLFTSSDVAFASVGVPSLVGSPSVTGYSPVANQTALFRTWVPSVFNKGNPGINIRASIASTTISFWTLGWLDSRQGSS